MFAGYFLTWERLGAMVFRWDRVLKAVVTESSFPKHSAPMSFSASRGTSRARSWCSPSGPAMSAPQRSRSACLNWMTPSRSWLTQSTCAALTRLWPHGRRRAPKHWWCQPQDSPRRRHVAQPDESGLAQVGRSLGRSRSPEPNRSSDSPRSARTRSATYPTKHDERRGRSAYSAGFET